MDTSTAYPLLLAIVMSPASAADADAMVVDLESLLVRRLICGRTTKNYNRLFLQILDETLGEGAVLSHEAFRKVLLSKTGDAVDWPKDDEFEKAWLHVPAYERLRHGRVEVVLRALELASATKKTESVTIHGDLTIEHVMPQGWEDHWPLPATLALGEAQQAEATRDALVQTFGNLTLLTQELNSSVSNGPYAGKRPEITLQSALRLNSYFQTTLDWNEAEILKRGHLLFEKAKTIWPRPPSD